MLRVNEDKVINNYETMLLDLSKMTRMRIENGRYYSVNNKGHLSGILLITGIVRVTSCLP